MLALKSFRCVLQLVLCQEFSRIAVNLFAELFGQLSREGLLVLRLVRCERFSCNLLTIDLAQLLPCVIKLAKVACAQNGLVPAVVLSVIQRRGRPVSLVSHVEPPIRLLRRLSC